MESDRYARSSRSLVMEASRAVTNCVTRDAREIIARLVRNERDAAAQTGSDPPFYDTSFTWLPYCIYVARGRLAKHKSGSSKIRLDAERLQRKYEALDA